MILTIHQPEHMPWLGFFNKAINSDIFVLLDTVQFEKDYFQNRNRIISKKTKNEMQWITVPVRKGKHTDLINEKIVCFDKKNKNRYLNQIHMMYSKHPFYKKTIQEIRNIINDNEVYLSKINTRLIKHFFNLLKIDTKLVLASDLNLKKSPPGGIVNYHISKALNANFYLSGKSGKEYLDEKVFIEDDIKVLYQNFNHPEYIQKNKKQFIPNLSILDLIFNYESEDALNIIKKGYKVNF